MDWKQLSMPRKLPSILKEGFFKREARPFFGQTTIDLDNMHRLMDPCSWLSSTCIDVIFHYISFHLDPSHGDLLFKEGVDFVQSLEECRITSGMIKNIYFPYNYRGNHWILIRITIDLSNTQDPLTIKVYDSLAMYGTSISHPLVIILDRILIYLAHAFDRRFAKPIAQVIATQKDGYNCGIAVCVLVYYFVIDRGSDESLVEFDYKEERLKFQTRVVDHLVNYSQ
jgi:Ulp1 protease family, C-terminal catalytic domain